MEKTDLASVRILVYGDVQGVFFRAYASRRARELGLKGYARNLPRGDSVEVMAEGEKGGLQELVTHLKVGPPAAKVARVITTWSEYEGRYPDFSIRF